MAFAEAPPKLPNLTPEQVRIINKDAKKVLSHTTNKPRWHHPDYPYHWKTNACGPDRWFQFLIPNGPIPFSQRWAPVCNEHDKVYIILTDTPVKTRQVADQRFHDELIASCHSHICRNMANLYTYWVITYPQSGFDASQKEQSDYQFWASDYIIRHQWTGN